MTANTLLLVDDEPHVLNSLKRLLRQENYRILTALNGREGLSMLREHPVQVVVSDQRMPEMTGTEFLQQVKALYPDTTRVVLSGYADVNVILDSINKGEIYRFLTKPWNDDELKVSLRQCFEQYALLQQNKSLLAQVQAQNDELRRLNDGLEQAVCERTQSLLLSQEILERLPIPVIGIGTDKMIVLVNDAARKRAASLGNPVLGADVQETLPPPLPDLVDRCVRKGIPVDDPDLKLGSESFRLHLRPLGETSLRGCIVSMESQRL